MSCFTDRLQGLNIALATDESGFLKCVIHSYENGYDTNSRCYSKLQQVLVALNFAREDTNTVSEKKRDGGGFLRDGKKPFLTVIFK